MKWLLRRNSGKKTLQTTEAAYSCPLCGCRFPDAAGKTACRGCPLAFGCRLIKCPNCGYDLPRQVLSVPPAAPLSKLRRGQGGKVADIYTPKSDQLQKLAVMGILPGTSISILQTYPTYVFQSGKTQFAVDQDIADAIYVRVDTNKPPFREDNLPVTGDGKEVNADARIPS